MISPETLRRLVALNLPAEGLQGVLLILAEMQDADDARHAVEETRRRKDRERKRKIHGNSEEVPGKIQGSSAETPMEIPPHTPLEERKIPEANASGDFKLSDGPTQAELEKELFRRGRQVCGKQSGGLIASLLKAKQHDVALARAVIETAATKHDPREYVAAAMRKHINGATNPTMAACDKLIAAAEGVAVEGNHPMRDITPGSR